jgi:hypothetical protein
MRSQVPGWLGRAARLDASLQQVRLPDRLGA